VFLFNGISLFGTTCLAGGFRIPKISAENLFSLPIFVYNEANEKPPSEREGDRVSGGRSLRDFRFELTSL